MGKSSLPTLATTVGWPWKQEQDGFLKYSSRSFDSWLNLSLLLVSLALWLAIFNQMWNAGPSLVEGLSTHHDGGRGRVALEAGTGCTLIFFCFIWVCLWLLWRSDSQWPSRCRKFWWRVLYPRQEGGLESRNRLQQIGAVSSLLLSATSTSTLFFSPLPTLLYSSQLVHFASGCAAPLVSSNLPASVAPWARLPCSFLLSLCSAVYHCTPVLLLRCRLPSLKSTNTTRASRGTEGSRELRVIHGLALTYRRLLPAAS